MKQPIIRLSLLGVGVLFLCSSTNTELNASETGVKVEENHSATKVPESSSNPIQSFLSDSSLIEEQSSEEILFSEEVGTTRSEEVEESTENSGTSESSKESHSEETSESVIESSEEESMDSSTEGSTESSEVETTEEVSTETESSDEASSEEGSSITIEDSSTESEEKESSIVVDSTVQLPSLSDKVTGSSQYLSKEFKANKFSKNNLAGFELPVLSSYLSKNQGALIYEGIKKIGLSESGKTTEEGIDQLYQKLFNQKLADFELKETTLQSLLEGDSLYFEKEGKLELIGLYLGNHFYLAMDQVKQQDGKKVATPKIKKLQSIENERLFVRRGLDADLTEYGQEVLREYPATFNFVPNFMTQRFIEKIGEDARILGLEYDVFPSVMIAQAILESGGGSSELSQAPYYNLFGIKGKYQGSSVTFATKEDHGNGEMFEIAASFRSYPSFKASLSDYVSLIRGGLSGNPTYYEGAWRSNAQNYLRATHELTGKYATDIAYNNKINSLIAVYNLTAYDEEIITDAGLFIQGTENVPSEYQDLMEYPNYDGKDYNTSGSYPVGQCTWYAYNRASQLGMAVDDFMGNGGEWGASGQRLGYHVSDTPEAGTLISFTPGAAGSSPQYGHVAFVEAVGPNGILISEGNVYGGTTISYRVIGNDLAYSNLVSYITAPQKE